MIIKSIIVSIWRQVSTKLFLDTEGHLTAPKHYRYLAEIYAAITILNKAWVIPSTNKTPVFHYCLNNSLFYLNLSLILFIVLATDTSALLLYGMLNINSMWQDYYVLIIMVKNSRNGLREEEEYEDH
jgi:hypothetical protein